ncbi:MAG: MFS transporter [Thermoactinospora sp.]|nr:MFS transporter [Thermoactinospora sp.]
MLWVGGAVSSLGSAVTGLALPLLLITVTGSSAFAGAVAFAGLAAGTLISVPAGVWVDRHPLKKVMLASLTVQMVCWGSVTVAILLGSVTLAHVFAAAIIGSLADAFFEPAQQVAIRQVVPAVQLPGAYAQDEARSHAANLGGPPLGGVLFTVGRAVPFLVDTISFLVAMVCLALVRLPHRATRPAAERPSMRQEAGQALRWLWGHRGIRAGLGLGLMANLTVNAMMLPLMIRAGDPVASGVVIGSLGVGGLLGALIAPRVTRMARAGMLFVYVLTLFALCMLASALPFGSYWPVVPMVLAMLAVPALNVALKTILATLVPGDMMGRVGALMQAASMGLVPFSPLVGGVLAQVLGGSRAMVVLGVVLLLTCAFAVSSGDLRKLAVPTTAG